jgi:flagellar hook-associated protein 1 FlgK
MVDQADTLRASVSGVSVDEEMVALIGQQQAYSAAARIVKVADDMMQSVLNMI